MKRLNNLAKVVVSCAKPGFKPSLAPKIKLFSGNNFAFESVYKPFLHSPFPSSFFCFSVSNSLPCSTVVFKRVNNWFLDYSYIQSKTFILLRNVSFIRVLKIHLYQRRCVGSYYWSLGYSRPGKILGLRQCCQGSSLSLCLSSVFLCVLSLFYTQLPSNCQGLWPASAIAHTVSTVLWKEAVFPESSSSRTPGSTLLSLAGVLCPFQNQRCGLTCRVSWPAPD